MIYTDTEATTLATACPVMVRETTLGGVMVMVTRTAMDTDMEEKYDFFTYKTHFYLRT